MSNRKITAKGFLSKSNTRAANSASAFISVYREWLITGEVASKTSPIVAKLDAGQLLPTPALNEIKLAVMTHIIEADRLHMEKSLEKQSETSPNTIPKTWTASIFDSQDIFQVRLKDNGDEEQLCKGFEKASDADRWVDRRLFDGASDWYAVIEGLGTYVVVDRQSAIARTLRKQKGPTCAVKSVSTRTLGFEVHAKQDRASFSRG
jgi:hypothetical protein